MHRCSVDMSRLFWALKFLDDGAKLRRKFGDVNTKVIHCNPLRKDVQISCSPVGNYQIPQDPGSSNATPAHRYTPHHPMPKIPIQSVSFSPEDILAHHFSSTFTPHLPRGKGLAKFGMFIKEVPRHVGLNKACDLSMMAVYHAHNALLTGNEKSLIQSRKYYGSALVELQHLLAGTRQRISEETLCAAMLLGIYEVRRRGFCMFELITNVWLGASLYG